MKVLHVTYWFPSTKQPFYGNFIENHIHAAAAFGGEHHVLYIDVVTDVGFIEVGYNLVKLDNNITLHHYKIACKYWKIPYNFLGLQSFIFKDFQRKMLRPAFLTGDKQKIQSCCDILDRLGYKPAFIEKLYCCSRAYFLTFPLLSLFHMLINSWKRIRK